ncbi:unnamed protein product [Caenorhabditis sp. 36 PRJEB53466]|nr:unnamed protein product [Caenorhabditis sp. 36 PRJEB53466]
MLSISSLLLCFLVLVPDAQAHLLRVKGNLKCAEFPAATVSVKLSKNAEKAVVAETHADKQGNFELSAETIEKDYTPFIVVFHDCDDGVKPGQRKFKFQVPKYYVGSGSTFDLGSFNLETRLKHNEERQKHVDRIRRGFEKTTTARNAFEGRDEEPDERNDPW